MSIIEAVWEGEDYGGELPTPVDTPLVTPIEAKTDMDKSLPLASTTKDEPNMEPKIEDNEAEVEDNETNESSEVDKTLKTPDEATKKMAAFILNSDAEETAPAPTAERPSSDTLA